MVPTISSRLAIVLATVVGSAAADAAAYAQPAPPPYDGGMRPPPPRAFPPPVAMVPDPAGPRASSVIVGGVFGAGAPLGIAGGEIGIGWGWGRAFVGAGRGLIGLEIGGTLELLVPRLRIYGNAVVFGLGLSRGPAVASIDLGGGEGPPERHAQYTSETLWGNVELGFEQAVTSRITGRGAVGVGIAFGGGCLAELQGHREACTSADRDQLDGWLPYVSGGVRVRLW